MTEDGDCKYKHTSNSHSNVRLSEKRVIIGEVYILTSGCPWIGYHFITFFYAFLGGTLHIGSSHDYFLGI